MEYKRYIIINGRKVEFSGIKLSSNDLINLSGMPPGSRVIVNKSKHFKGEIKQIVEEGDEFIVTASTPVHSIPPNVNSLSMGIYKVIKDITIPINENDVATTSLGDLIIIHNNKVYAKHYPIDSEEYVYIETYLSPTFVVVNHKIFEEQ